MKNLFTAFAFSGLLLSGCNSFNTVLVEEEKECKPCCYDCQEKCKSISYMNTSKTKYLEVTFKNSDRDVFRKLKPGETTYIRINCEQQAPEVVGEREITEITNN